MLLPVHGLAAATYIYRYSRAELHRNLIFLVLLITQLPINRVVGDKDDST